MCVCACVCVFVCLCAEREREREREILGKYFDSNSPHFQRKTYRPSVFFHILMVCPVLPSRSLPAVSGHLYSYDPATMIWTQLSSSGLPPCRSGHGFASVGTKLYVHGGYSTTLEELSDFYSFDSVDNSWTRLELESAPVARRYHGFTSAGGKLYLHGGTAGGGECEPTHTKLATTWMVYIASPMVCALIYGILCMLLK